MALRCKLGDMVMIVRTNGHHAKFLGRVSTTVSYMGAIPNKLHEHYWELDKKDFPEIAGWKTIIADDSFLMPLRPGDEQLDDTTTITKEHSV